MDTAALPADGLRQRAAVTRRTPLVLCDLIDLYAAEAGRSRAAAAHDLERIFRAIDRHTLVARPSGNPYRPHMYPTPLDPSACWVGMAADPLAISSEELVYPQDLADYFKQRARGARSPAPCIACGGGSASEEAVYIAPEPLAHLIEASGQRVPAFLLCDPVPAEAVAPAPAAGAGRKRAARQSVPLPEQSARMKPIHAAMNAAWLKFWAPWVVGQPAPSQQDVQIWIAERVGSGRITRKIEEAANIIRPEEAPDQHGKYKTRP